MNKTVRPGMERAPTSMALNKPLSRLRLDGQVALIFGGGGKIGIETAGRLLVEGATVAIVDIDQPALEGAIPVLRAALPTGVPIESRLLTIAADAPIEEDVEACVKKTLQRFDRLDIALLNAGVRDEAKSLFDQTEEDYQHVMDVNVKSGKHQTPHIQCYNHFNKQSSFLRCQARRRSHARPWKRRLHHLQILHCWPSWIP